MKRLLPLALSLPLVLQAPQSPAQTPTQGPTPTPTPNAFALPTSEKFTDGVPEGLLRATVSIEHVVNGSPIAIGSGVVIGSFQKHYAIVTAGHVVTGNKGVIRSDLVYRLNRKGSASKLLADQDVNSFEGSWFLSDSERSCPSLSGRAPRFGFASRNGSAESVSSKSEASGRCVSRRPRISQRAKIV